ncbi:hypothetical protein [Actinoalloteichus hymeniacidonis]|uniref:Uncharacterized protein n=1 Tax=Actinoalloteichus hymeniacidonis TaxID=340345 RepID=A0AAC9MWC0_9PSEU|nr:hypothetical protein [Actinoalloteichus hymeniacidonis]AOS61140.1 hypothetical protein TL08_01500 [Actinoalloteichus hymeniacidonis]MBB5910859.1 hypothetical protein [Actinoalloteichus hymeniacidonis]
MTNRVLRVLNLERLFYPVGVAQAQLSFFSSEARPPRVDDLGGLLCAQGQAVGFGHGTAARISVITEDAWRVRELRNLCLARGVDVELARSDEGYPLLRTAFRTDLAALAARWLRGAMKSVPAGLELHGPALRIWAAAAGRMDGSGFLLGLDPRAPDTHGPIAEALARSGLPAAALGARAGGPALRVTGRRRIARLAELVGAAPTGVGDADEVLRCWPSP